MKYNIFFIAVISFSFSIKAQIPGQWTWMKGVKTVNYPGNYGVMGVPDSTNQPPGLYEAEEWTDIDRNFWLYGGEAHNSSGYVWLDDLWKYDVANNIWTWVKGSGGVGNQEPTYGIQGIPSITNSPGERSTSASWTDSKGNLWLYGGGSFYGTNAACGYNDLWKYDRASNMWTWMKGDSGCASSKYQYGIKGIEDSFNNPAGTDETAISWADKNDNLLMLTWGNIWKFSIQTNNWTWMNGDTINYTPYYGQKGIASPNTQPGSDDIDYTRWIDSYDNLWYLYTHKEALRVLFRYNIQNNMWTWIWGDTILQNPLPYTKTYYGDKICNYNFSIDYPEVIPFSRAEGRACWTDNCDNLWIMGGEGTDKSGTEGLLNDLIYFDTQVSRWIWVGGDTVLNKTSIYGTMGVSSASNKPGGRDGSMPFKDKDGNLWLYGGNNWNSSPKFFGDLWRYGMYNGCSPCSYLTNVRNEPASNEEISIFPNPFSATTTIHFSHLQSHCVLKTYSIVGEIIKSEEFKNADTFTIENNGYENGMYILQIIDEHNNIINKKIVISKQ